MIPPTLPHPPHHTYPLTEQSCAFPRPTRFGAYCRALAAQRKAGTGEDPSGVAAGTYVEVIIADVPQEVAAAVVQRVAASLQVCQQGVVSCVLSSRNVLCFKIYDYLPENDRQSNCAELSWS
jgi:hypothetical protein